MININLILGIINLINKFFLVYYLRIINQKKGFINKFFLFIVSKNLFQGGAFINEIPDNLNIKNFKRSLKLYEDRFIAS